jgi:hypothetical protein
LKNIDHEAILSEFLKAETNMEINGKEYSRVLNSHISKIEASVYTDKTFANGDYYKARDGKEYIYYDKYLYRIKPAA